ncbi:MAG TPA: oxidoreductase [Ferruginibacter sp.]|jgi:NAD(P)-dependent dehydrogenase (short-subunit alcohol dehydrogenase family)|nr:oxidoreductase [Ferruginibacter sp.]
MFSIKDKVIVVTGSNGLLGNNITKVLRDEGAIVIGADIRFENKTENDYLMDITDEKSVTEVVKTIVEKYHKINGWLNNAYPRTKDWGNKLEDVPLESWRSNIDMHLNGYFLCCKIVLAQMKIQGYGSLINMSSIYGVVGPDFTVYDGTAMTTPVAYSAIKGGLINLSRYLAAYYGPYQVRVNCISPGGIFDNQPKVFVDNYNKKVPMRRMGQSKDITAAVVFLLADETNYITGHNLIVDGGWTSI